jgi:hypothetical protein
VSELRPVDLDVWLAKERWSDHEAVYLVFGYEPPNHRLALPLAAMREFSRWLHAQGLCHPDPQRAGLVLDLSTYVQRVELEKALRAQRPIVWGRPYLAAVDAFQPRPSTARRRLRAPDPLKTQRVQAMKKYLRSKGVRGAALLNLQSHGYPLKGMQRLHEELRQQYPELFRQLRTEESFRTFFGEQDEVRFRGKRRTDRGA